MVTVAVVDHDEAARARPVLMLSGDPSVQMCGGFARLDEISACFRRDSGVVVFLDLRPLAGIPAAVTATRLAPNRGEVNSMVVMPARREPDCTSAAFTSKDVAAVRAAHSAR